MTNPSSRPAPAARAAGANAENTPAPIIEPNPITTASPVPNRRASPGSRLTTPPEGQLLRAAGSKITDYDIACRHLSPARVGNRPARDAPSRRLGREAVGIAPGWR